MTGRNLIYSEGGFDSYRVYCYTNENTVDKLKRKNAEQIQVTESGFNGFNSGISSNDCPYPSVPINGDVRRTWWFNGWLDARSQKNCPTAFARFPGYPD